MVQFGREEQIASDATHVFTANKLIRIDEDYSEFQSELFDLAQDQPDGTVAFFNENFVCGIDKYGFNSLKGKGKAIKNAFLQFLESKGKI